MVCLCCASQCYKWSAFWLTWLSEISQEAYRLTM